MEWAEWLRDHAWESWLTLAVALAALELVSLDLIFVMLAGGALVGVVTALLGGPFFIGLLVAGKRRSQHWGLG